MGSNGTGIGGCVIGAGTANAVADQRKSEQALVDLIREDLGVTIEPQAFRMFIRSRWCRISPLAHRINDGKR